MRYPIEFTADELEMLNTALLSGAIRFADNAKAGCRIAAIWRDETNDLWLKIHLAQKAAGLKGDAVQAAVSEQMERTES